MRQHRGLARVVGLTGHFDIHLEHVSVQLLNQTDGLLGTQLQRLEERGDLGQYPLEGREGFAFLQILIAAVLVLIRLRIPTIVVASLVPTIAVAAIPLAYACSVPVTAR